MRIVIAAHTPIGSPFVVGSHQLAKEISLLGNEVVHVPFPFTPWELLLPERENFLTVNTKSFFKEQESFKLRQLWFLSLMPKRASNFLKFKLFLKLYSFFSYSFNNNKICDVLIIDHPYQAFTILKYKPKVIIYRPTDIYCSDESGAPDISHFEKFVLEKCHGIIATSTVTLNHLIKKYPKNLFESNNQKKLTKVITNGVSLNDFKSSESVSKSEKPTAVYVGSIDFRFDIDICNQLAEANPDINFLIIGPANLETRAKFKAPNIVLTGAIEYDKLPQILEQCHIGLLLANQHVFNSSRSPMKLYEYASAGLPVVSSHIEEVASREEEFVLMYKNFETANLAIKQAFKNRGLLGEKAREIAKNHSWSNKTKQLLDICSDLM